MWKRLRPGLRAGFGAGTAAPAGAPTIHSLSAFRVECLAFCVGGLVVFVRDLERQRQLLLVHLRPSVPS